MIKQKPTPRNKNFKKLSVHNFTKDKIEKLNLIENKDSPQNLNVRGSRRG